MPRYIDADKLEKRLADFSNWCRDDRKAGVDFVIKGILPDSPTAFVREVEIGNWEMIKKDRCRCSECGFQRNIETQFGWKFCPNCGKDMGVYKDNNQVYRR